MLLYMQKIHCQQYGHWVSLTCCTSYGKEMKEFYGRTVWRKNKLKNSGNLLWKLSNIRLSFYNYVSAMHVSH